MPPVGPCSIGGASNDCPPSRRRRGRADGGRLLSSWGVLADTSCCIGDCAMTGRGGGDDEEAACDGDVCSNDSWDDIVGEEERSCLALDAEDSEDDEAGGGGRPEAGVGGAYGVSGDDASSNEGSEHDVGVSELGGASDAGESEGGGGARVRKRTRVTLNNYASYRMQFRPGQPTQCCGAVNYLRNMW